MTGPVVTNSTCLIALEAIGRLDLLPGLFGEVLAPPAVVEEVGAAPVWLKVSQPNTHLVQALRLQVHEGEAEAIALAMENSDATIILDDRKARRVARRVGLYVVGTVGLLLRAKEAGLVSEVRALLRSLEAVGFRMNEELRRKALTLARESE